MNKTLRDEIAIEAMKCLMTDEIWTFALNKAAQQSGVSKPEFIAQAAYDMADLMMAERESRR